MQTQNPETLDTASPFFTVDVTRAAQDARLYRIAARDLRKAAREEKARPVQTGFRAQRQRELLTKARRMERNARMAEKAIVRAADELLTRAV